MVTEGEITESELRQIRLQNTVIRDIQFSQYVLTPVFKNEFKRIQKKTCKECGKHFRITHWCYEQDKQIWIPNWEAIIRANFKPEEREISVYIIEENENIQVLQEEQRRSPIIIPTKSVDLAKPQPQLKKMKIPTQPPASKPQPIPVNYASPIEKKPSIRSQYTSEDQKKKLSVHSINQLTQRERLVYEQLINWRSIQANRERKPVFNIAVDTALMAVVFYRVSSTQELMQISGFTPHTAQQYGTDILRIMIRNGMATGINTYQQKRKPLPTPKNVGNEDTTTKKIIGGFVCCVVIVVIFIVLTQL